MNEEDYVLTAIGKIKRPDVYKISVCIKEAWDGITDELVKMIIYE